MQCSPLLPQIGCVVVVVVVVVIAVVDERLVSCSRDVVSSHPNPFCH